MHIPDNYDLWEAHDREQTEWLKKLPKCSICDEPIQQEKAFHIEDFWFCDECIETYKREVILDE